MTLRNVVFCLFIPVMACSAAELRLAPPAAGADAVPLLREAIRRCKAEGISRLVLEKGVWHLYPERASGMYRHVSNHDACYRRVGIWLEGMKDFELDGQGSTLLCHGVLSTIAVDRSEKITLRNFTVDWDKPFHLEGTVREVGEDWFEVDFLPECGAMLYQGRLLGGVADLFIGELMDSQSVRQDFRWNYWIDPATRAAATVQPPWLNLWNPAKKVFAEVTETGSNRFRIKDAVSVLPTRGSVMVCKGMNLPNRLTPVIHLSSADRATVENVTVRHAGGMGVIAEDCMDPVVRRFRVELREKSRSLITTTADATHFVGCYGTVRVEECFFENMLDDSCNVHGVYAKVEGLVASNQLEVSFSHFQQLGTVFARPGDTVRLTSRETLLGYAECRVVSVERHNDDCYVLTVDRPLTNVYQTNSSLENLTARPDVIYRCNTVRNNRARGMLVTSGGKVLIEENLFERPSMAGILIEGDNDFWYESGAVGDVTIRRNRFVGLDAREPIFRLSPLQRGEKRAQPPYHRNIRILDNEIRAAGPLIIEARRVSGLEFSGNTVTFEAQAEKGSTDAFQLTDCEAVRLRNNTFSRTVTVKTTPGTLIVRENNRNLNGP